MIESQVKLAVANPLQGLVQFAGQGLKQAIPVPERALEPSCQPLRRKAAARQLPIVRLNHLSETELRTEEPRGSFLQHQSAQQKRCARLHHNLVAVDNIDKAIQRCA